MTELKFQQFKSVGLTKKLYYKVNNCRMITICSDGYINEIYNSKKEIVSLDIAGNLSININEDFIVDIMGKSEPFKIRYITKDVKGKYILLTHKRNKTSTYLLPILSTTNLYRPIYFQTKLALTKANNRHFYLYDDYLVNAYISKDKTKLELLYRFVNDETYKSLEDKLITHELFSKCIENDPYYTKFIFNIPQEYKYDVILFLEGKYSQLSSQLKSNIKKFFGENTDKSRVMQILEKSKILKSFWEEELAMSLNDDMELESKPDIKLEIL